MKMHKDLLLEGIFCRKKSIFCSDKTNMAKQTSNHIILLSIIKGLDVTHYCAWMLLVFDVIFMLIFFVIITLSNQSFFDHDIIHSDCLKEF